MQQTERLSAIPELLHVGRPKARAGGAAERERHDRDRTSVRHQPPRITLYGVTSIEDDFRFDSLLCDHVCVHWYVVERVTPVGPYESLIAGYPPNMSGAPDGCRKVDEWSYARDAVDELFTAAEAEELQRYLDSTFALASTITSVALPIPRDVICYTSICMGRYEGEFRLFKRNGYGLSVPVNGYYDLGDHDVVLRQGPLRAFLALGGDKIPF